ncbi:Metallothiol transferase FosB [Kordia antarctica]|uniref:Metallothiol transferase FosB n=1 Tax=Kordia antarctica TaxID=1218801 RepID=A0A7L4ZLH0_9FLAO|nr:VOC family protein [Kordia antarctica]QHI36794.1 Metallothiol transferase FosB [Kordia antarctica]
MIDFKLDFLDHVAINVKDMNASVAWYEKVLGLKRYQSPKWGEFPIFMLSGKTGIALFPANSNDPKLDLASNNVKIDHFAFQVSQESFAKAKQHYQDLGLTFTVKDHHYFHSIYTEDLDGHVVELTTLVVDEDAFYKQKI